MNVLSRKLLGRLVPATLSVLTLTLSACSNAGDQGEPENINVDTSPESTAEALLGTPAVPDSSPHSSSDLLGVRTTPSVFKSVVALGGKQDFLAALAPGHNTTTIYLGTGQTLGTNQGFSTTVDKECSSLSTSTEGAVLNCGDSIGLIDDSVLQSFGGSSQDNSSDSKVKLYSVEGQSRINTLTRASDGSFIVGLSGERNVFYGSLDGDTLNLTKGEDITKSIDEAILVQGLRGEHIALIDRAQTSITDISAADKHRAGALRAGSGIGQASSGYAQGATDGILLASDTRGGQLLIYTMNEVIVHHQSLSLPQSPYAVAWDEKRQMAWVSTTADNRLTAFSIKTGTPVAQVSIPTIANVRQILLSDEGDLLLNSSEGKVQHIEANDLSDRLSTATPSPTPTAGLKG